MNQARSKYASMGSSIQATGVERREIQDEESFTRMLAIERKRTERSKEPFLLMLLEIDHQQEADVRRDMLDRILITLLPMVRDIDILGWYHQDETVGVIYTGLSLDGTNMILNSICRRVQDALQKEVSSSLAKYIVISFHYFPDDWEPDRQKGQSDAALYPDLYASQNGQRLILSMKRGMDIVGSALLLLLCSPLLLIIAAAVKATSKGPILFKQERVGEYGQLFTFLKFRSMQIDNDSAEHREYVTKLIANQIRAGTDDHSSNGVFKLTNDKRITRIGRLLRRTSLDELPQLFNVLRGEMSLVGPRPALPYELAAYQTWHRRRVLGIKPGITGLWQVNGRSRVTFDEMVRLDLRYGGSWTPWVDCKIMARTPLIVIRGDGAY